VLKPGGTWVRIVHGDDQHIEVDTTVARQGRFAKVDMFTGNGRSGNTPRVFLVDIERPVTLRAACCSTNS